MIKKILKFLVVLAVILPAGLGFYFHNNYSVPILMYHSIDESKVDSYAAVSPDIFRQQMKFIKNRGYNMISLADYCRLINNGEMIPKNTAVITFDDGYKDNLDAIKILNAFGFPATIFLIADKIGRENYLTTHDINWLLNNTKIEIGSHTYSHAYLPDITDEQMINEIKQSREELQNTFNCEVRTLAYPIGGFDQRILRTAEDADYLCACSTNRGFSKKLNRFTLRRIKITNRDNGISLWVKLSGFYNAFKKPKKPF